MDTDVIRGDLRCGADTAGHFTWIPTVLREGVLVELAEAISLLRTEDGLLKVAEQNELGRRQNAESREILLREILTFIDDADLLFRHPPCSTGLSNTSGQSLIEEVVGEVAQKPDACLTADLAHEAMHGLAGYAGSRERDSVFDREVLREAQKVDRYST
jgi:hypothetical protein